MDVRALLLAIAVLGSAAACRLPGGSRGGAPLASPPAPAVAAAPLATPAAESPNAQSPNSQSPLAESSRTEASRSRGAASGPSSRRGAVSGRNEPVDGPQSIHAASFQQDPAPAAEAGAAPPPSLPGAPPAAEDPLPPGPPQEETPARPFEVPQTPVNPISPNANLESLDAPGELPEAPQLEDVLVSVRSTFPLLLATLEQRRIASGRVLSATGEFDTQLSAESLSQPIGYYKTYRQRAVAMQPMYGGGYLYGGYRLGEGSFEPWFGERQTNQGGEFKAGFGVPLLQNREIDKRRAALWRARLERNEVEPEIRSFLRLLVRDAAEAYWLWVAADLSLEAQQELLDLALQRAGQIEAQVEAEDLARIALLDNQRFIADRQGKVVQAAQKRRESAIQLSLFWRDAEGRPNLPPEEVDLPAQFPATPTPIWLDAAAQESVALANRPELQQLRWQMEQVRVDLAQAENMLLPKFDAVLGGGQDMGSPTSSKRDKSRLEVEAGFKAEVPWQRREARGKIRSAQGKLAQLSAKQRMVADTVVAEVRAAAVAADAALRQLDLARLNQDLALQALELAQESFRAGDIDLILLNIYETSATTATLDVIQSQARLFIAIADYEAALSQ